MNQETIRIHPSWRNDKWSDPDSGSDTSDALSVSTCSASSCQCDPCRSYREYLEWKKKAGKGATPETDAQLNLSGAGGPPPWHVHADFARKMERERDDARATVIDVLSALVAFEHEGPRLAAMRVMDERDTARVVAADAIRKLDRILDTRDTYTSREIVQNLKDSLRGISLPNADVMASLPRASAETPTKH